MDLENEEGDELFVKALIGRRHMDFFAGKLRSSTTVQTEDVPMILTNAQSGVPQMAWTLWQEFASTLAPLLPWPRKRPSTNGLQRWFLLRGQG